MSNISEFCGFVLSTETTTLILIFEGTLIYTVCVTRIEPKSLSHCKLLLYKNVEYESLGIKSGRRESDDKYRHLLVTR